MPNKVAPVCALMGNDDDFDPVEQPILQRCVVGHLSNQTPEGSPTY
jgi:hypothetical protein